MNDLIREHLVDRSDDKSFSFSLTCTSCGKVWKSPSIRFSPLYTKLSPRQHYEKYAAAQEAALQAVEKSFGLCSLCGSPTCAHCMVNLDSLLICRNCADRCTGKAVSTHLSHSQNSNSGWVFDVGPFRLIPRLNYWLDGCIGQRSLFISDEDGSFTVSFEEGMACLDISTPPSPSYIDAEYRCDRAYLHQRRKSDSGNNLYFHIELSDAAGTVRVLTGQMVAEANYHWSAGVEPILLDILNSLL